MFCENRKIACVTGASGLIGRRIVAQLHEKGYHVKVLTRRSYFDGQDQDIEIYKGDLQDESVVRSFLHRGHMVFHCAAEIRDVSKMWEVNVHGTKRLFSQLNQSEIEYFCYISSAGVIGKTSKKWVDERTQCCPQNLYERSKWAAEQIVAQGLSGCRIVILRPTNVVDVHKPGAIGMPMRGAWSDRLKVFLKGGEYAHIVHADDVAQAALYLNSHPIDEPECFFVSCDHERFNTYSELWSLYGVIKRKKTIVNFRPALHLPPIIPYLLRKLWRGTGNRGDIRYSSEKLLSTGFRYHLGVEGAVRRIAMAHHSTVS